MHYKGLQVDTHGKTDQTCGDSLCLVPSYSRLWSGPSPLESPPRGNEETALLILLSPGRSHLKQPHKMGWFLLSKISRGGFSASFTFSPHLIQQLSVPMVRKVSLDASTSYFSWKCGSAGFLLDILLIQSSSRVMSLFVMSKIWHQISLLSLLSVWPWAHCLIKKLHFSHL